MELMVIFVISLDKRFAQLFLLLFGCSFLNFITQMWTNQLNWPYSQEFLSAPREIWFVDENIAGYRQFAANLSMIAVNNAGHMVSTFFIFKWLK